MTKGSHSFCLGALLQPHVFLAKSLLLDIGEPIPKFTGKLQRAKDGPALMKNRSRELVADTEVAGRALATQWDRDTGSPTPREQRPTQAGSRAMPPPASSQGLGVTWAFPKQEVRRDPCPQCSPSLVTP